MNAGDVDKVEADERNNNNTGLLAKGGPTAKIQVNPVRSLVLAPMSHIWLQTRTAKTLIDQVRSSTCGPHNCVDTVGLVCT